MGNLEDLKRQRDQAKAEYFRLKESVDGAPPLGTWIERGLTGMTGMFEEDEDDLRRSLKHWTEKTAQLRRDYGK